MAAILEPRQLHTDRRPALRLVSASDGRTTSVPLDLGLGAGHVIAAVAALILTVMAAAIISSGALGALAPAPAPVSAPAASSAGSANTIVVKSGDTLWSIARSLTPAGDVRPVVDQLLELNGSAPLQPGQRVVLPS